MTPLHPSRPIAAAHLSLAQIEPLGEPTRGNRIRLYDDGDDYFRAMWADIEAARRRVWAEFYIFEDDSVGRHTRDLLAGAAERGCEARLLYDRAGSILLPPGFFDGLRDTGAHVVAFNSPDALLKKRRRTRSPLHRDHRKVLMIDDQVSYTGGANVGEAYAGRELGTSAYHDLMVRIDGPATGAVADVYQASWTSATGTPAPAITRPATRGSSETLILRFNGDEGLRPLNEALRRLIEGARKCCFLSTPYFIPPPWLRNALIDASRRGVDVRVMTSGDSDVPAALYAGRHTYGGLLPHGVRIFEYFGRTLHDKYVMADGALAVIGSHNFDRWSENHNLEIGLVVNDPSLIDKLDQLFHEAMTHCRELRLDQWRHRPWRRRALEWAAHELARL